MRSEGYSFDLFDDPDCGDISVRGMEVKLISHTPDPERLAFMAAKACHHPGDLNSLIEESKDMEKVRSYNMKAIELGQCSFLEHPSFTFWISGISQICLTYLTGYRLSSHSVSPQRGMADGFVMPPSMRHLPDIIVAMNDIYTLYNCLMELAIPEEDARFILPQGISSQLIITANAKEYRDIIALGMNGKAQWEMRKLSRMMLGQLCEVAPSLFEDIKSCDKGIEE